MKKIVKRILWWPNLIKQVQKNDILKALNLNEGCKVLDIACGQGHFDHYAKRKNPGITIVGGDIRKHESWAQFENIKFMVMDAHKLPFKDKTFDRVLLSEIISLIPDPDIVLQEATRILKDDGHIVIVNGLGYQTIARFYKSKLLRPLRSSLSRFLSLPPTYYDFMRFFVRSDMDSESFGNMYCNIEANMLRLIGKQANLRLEAKKYSINRINEFMLAVLILVRACFGKRLPRFNYYFLYPIASLFEMFSIGRKTGLTFILKLTK